MSLFSLSGTGRVNYNDDVWTEILLCLPAKSLTRFKLVCKSWLSLISFHQFCYGVHWKNAIHWENYPSTHLYFDIDKHIIGKLPYAKVPWPEDKSVAVLELQEDYSEWVLKYHDRIGRIPGASCLLGFITGDSEEEASTLVFHVPGKIRAYRFHDNSFNELVDLTNEPFYKEDAVQFEPRDTYRATRRKSGGFFRGRWQCCQIEVYESKTSIWKLCGEPFFAPRNVRFDQGIYWNDAIHWTGIFFDFHNNFVGEHPEIVLLGPNLTNLFDGNYIESNGYLHCVAHSPEEKSISVFELQRDYSEWSLKFHINVDHVSVPLSVLSIIRRDSEEDSTLVAHQPGKIMVYKFQDSSFNELIDFSKEAFYQEGRIQFGSHCTFQFTKTLAPP
ncbi:hypothetical protein BUALT_Bualt06G0141200 [Buddleja alternifolia]|uniref:F-box domain-containing protein n=1 Tax=Buddleja alternifolia TaxID=168488 RepID=A0AAV6XLY6_9LAMI|nr:hypothetical protein BUALT_Bualt06G0141200 [Buddleja alternifolia]